MTGYSISRRRAQMKHHWGLTLEQYDELLEKQNGECAICHRHHSDFKLRLAVDHNHQTNEIRGLLCQYCNHVIVRNHTTGDFFKQVITYLEQGTGYFKPERSEKNV